MQYIFIAMAILPLCFMVLACVRTELVYAERSKMIDLIYDREDYEYYKEFLNVVCFNDIVFAFFTFPIKKMWPKELQGIRNAA